MKEWRLNLNRTLALALFVIVVLNLGWLKFIDANRGEAPQAELQFEAISRSAASGRLIVDNQYAVNIQLPASATYRAAAIPLPHGPEPVTGIRLDPLMQAGEIQFRNMRVVLGGEVIARVGIENVEALNPLAVPEATADGWKIGRTGNDDYPALAITGILPLDMPLANSKAFGSGTLWLCWFLGAALCALLVYGMYRSARSAGWGAVALFGGVFLVIFGARLITIHLIGDRVPNWDYWQMPWTVYLPFADGNLTWHGMIAPINEHRIFFARLFSLGLFELNGQWENLYEAMAMSGMHALTATGLALVLWNAFGRKHAAAILVLVVASTALPFSWENTVWANQSQFYFFVGFSILTIWLLGMHRPFTARWWLGASAALAAQFTVGSGMLAPIVVIGLTVYRLMRDRDGRRDAAITLGVTIGLAAFASLFRVKSQSTGMMTKTMDQFIQTFGKTLSWPFNESVWIWVILWAPLFLLVGYALIKKTAWSRAEAWTVALGGWVFLNALGVGIFRGAFSSGPISRYMDLTAVGVISNGLALILLAPSFATKRWFSCYRCIWIALTVIGVLWVTNVELSGRVKIRLEHQRLSAENVAEFLRTDDLQDFATKKEYEIPHPDPMRLASWLRSEKMLAILPVSIRKPITLEQNSAVGFLSPGLYPPYNFDLKEPTWGSYGREGDRTMGSFLSKPIRAPRYAYLAVPAVNRIACRQKTVTLNFVDPETQKSYRACAGRDALGGWQMAYARVPKKPLILEAKDNDSVFWVAFQSPRELSAVSYWSFKVIAAGPAFLGAGLLLVVGGYRRDDEGAVSE